jgi:transcriptional regulator with XRE-family HTH domain
MRKNWYIGWKWKGESMPQYELSTLKSLRKFLIANSGHVKMRRLGPEKAEIRRRTDETLLAFRVARKAAADPRTAVETGSWLRTVRQAVGVPVYVVARRLGVTKYEIFRLEKAERESRIVLGTLRRAAEALGCELIYALAPREGSLEDLADLEKAEREKAQEAARAKNEKTTAEVEEWIDWDAAIRQMFRREMRKMKIRVR